MARRRYISTQISIDADTDELAQQYGDFAALLYTWMIPHAADDATITGDPGELMFTVVPRRRDKTISDVIAALEGMEALGLIIWDREGKAIYFPIESFYHYQSYIREEKRRKEDYHAQQRTSPPIAEEQRITPEKAVSPSPSPSPSPSLKEIHDVGQPDDAHLGEPLKAEKIPYQEIIDHLNLLAGTNYKYSSKATQKSIHARWKEGFRLPDFQQVIEKKVKEWLSTEYEKFIRPETLFGTKFEGYLNQPEGGTTHGRPTPPKQPSAGKYAEFIT